MEIMPRLILVNIEIPLVSAPSEYLTYTANDRTQAQMGALEQTGDPPPILAKEWMLETLM
jgi:hypothetical protein